MGKTQLEICFDSNKLILTEGAVGQRMEHEFSLKPDADIMYASLIYSAEGRDALAAIYRSYLQAAEDYRLPILLMTNTRRANKDRVLRSEYRDKNMMRDYACFLRELASDYTCPVFIGGMMGCKGDAYSGSEGLSTDEAIEYHSWQRNMFDTDSIDFLFAGIMPALPEALGMAEVMEESKLPYIISLMINEHGTLLDGNTIHEAISVIDTHTEANPLCYMTNCVHPAILRSALSQPENRTEAVRARFCGIQANAACLSLQELDNSCALKTSDAKELAEEFRLLHRDFPLKIYGGCCGTDESHIREMIKVLQ